MRGKFIKKLLLGIVLAVVLIPYPTMSIPEWRIRVVDKNMIPVKNVVVFQTWSHGSLLGESKDTLISNDEGYVIFPERNLFLPIIIRIPLRFLQLLNNLLMPHGSQIDGHAMVGSPEVGGISWLSYYGKGDLKETLVINR